jgi:TRAP-type C4-dicarboxylate transport system substrate-binding protein
VATHYSFDEHTMIPDVLLVGTERMQAFTPRQRDVLREAATASYHHMNKLWQTFETKARADVQQMGVTFVRPDKAPFIAKAGPLADIYAGEDVSRVLLRRIAQA